jgi:hypothetical protein
LSGRKAGNLRGERSSPLDFGSLLDKKHFCYFPLLSAAFYGI